MQGIVTAHIDSLVVPGEKSKEQIIWGKDVINKKKAGAVSHLDTLSITVHDKTFSPLTFCECILIICF